MESETEFRASLREYLSKKCNSYSSSKLLPLVMPTFGPEEIMEGFDSLADLNVTMGSKVEKLEADFSAYLCPPGNGGKPPQFATMVNSGSSANLLALSILSNPSIPNPIKPGDEVIVPSVTWSTSIFPILNIGAVPVLVDAGEDYLIDTEKLKESLSPKTRAIMPVHLLGNVCDMGAVNDIAKDNGLYVIEDCCEAMGSEYKGKKVGTLSDLSSFSTYFSHHITTGEGGFLCTSNFDYADLSRILRAHGYVRHSLKREKHIQQNPGIDPRFLFVNMGYNFRPMEIQGAFGIHQLKKLEGFIAKRAEAGRTLNAELEKYSEYLILPKEKKDTRHTWFAYPITIREGAPFSREELTAHLEKNGIETRPLVCGNFAEQPAMKLFPSRKGNLSNSEYIMRNSFYIGIHPQMDDETIRKAGEVFAEFFSGVKK
jgi:CDP-6-deoxy-D-xylo-4-hexulose-3-dehydrase